MYSQCPSPPPPSKGLRGGRGGDTMEGGGCRPPAGTIYIYICKIDACILKDMLQCSISERVLFSFCQPNRWEGPVFPDPFSRMRSEGSRFTLGVWGQGCVRQMLRLCPQPSASVCNRLHEGLKALHSGELCRKGYRKIVKLTCDTAG